MGYPSFDFLHEFPPTLRRELESFIARLQGYLSQEHDDTGAHGAITATSVSSAMVRITGRAAPQQITSDTNDYAINGSGRAFIFSDAARNITGIAKGLDGELLWIVNYGGFAITLKYNSASSSAVNRILAATGADVVLRANNSSALLQYDSGSGFWWVLGA